MVIMLCCHHDTVSTYYANPIIMLSVENHKEAFLLLDLMVDCQVDTLQDVSVP